MKKLSLLFAIILIISLSVLVVACANQNTTTTPSGGNLEEEKVIVDYANISTIVVSEADKVKEEGFLLSEFNISQIKLLITYLNGETVLLDANNNMIKAEDKAKLSVTGTHSITLIYGKYSIPFQIKLYSQESVKYSVVFLDEDGDRVIETQYLYANELAVVPKLGTKQGYTHVGWKDRETNTMVTEFVFSKNTVLVAVFEPNFYEVKYYSTIGENSILIGTAMVPRGGNALEYAPSIPIYSGYSNGRWNNVDTMENVNSEGLEFFAIYDRDKVLVTFSYYKYNEEQYHDYKISWMVDNETEGITPPSDAENTTDNIFVYWYIEKNGKKIPVTFPYKVVAEVQFKAYYIPVSEGTSGLVYEYNGEDGYVVSDYVGEDKIVVIPDKHYDKVNGELPVKSIKEGAFRDKEITKFYVRPNNNYFRIYNRALYNVDRTILYAYPKLNDSTSFEVESVTKKICAYAFYSAQTLSAIKLPSQIETIGEYAFSECTSLLEMALPETLTIIETGLFKCEFASDLKKLTIGKHVVKIKDEAFFGLSALNEIALYEELEDIGVNVFYGCNSLTKVSIINNDIFSVDNGALYGRLSANSPNPHYYLYLYPSKHTSNSAEYEVNENARVVRSGAFVNAILTGIYISSDEIVLEENSIVCPSLTSVRFEETSVTASANSFGNFLPIIYALSEATIPSDFTVNEYTLSNWSEYRNFVDNYSYTVKNKKATITAYKGTDEHVIIPEKFGSFEVESIDKYAFANNMVLKSISLPNSVVNLSNSAFENCRNLEYVKIGDGLKTLGDKVFNNCIKLSNIETNALVETCGKGIFDNTLLYSEEGLSVVAGIILKYNGYDSEIIIPNDVTIIYDGAFENRVGIRSIEFEDNSVLTIIGERAFANCIEIIEIEFPTSLIKIDKFAFDGCSMLYNVSDLDEISCGESAFRNTAYANGEPKVSDWVIENKELKAYNGVATEIIIPNDVEKLSEGIFKDNDTITKVVFNNNITIISEEAFARCTNLVEIVLNNKLIKIEERAFVGCNKLSNINFTDATNLTEIAYSSLVDTLWFKEYTDDTIIINDVLISYNGTSSELHVKNSTLKINEYAFYNNKTLKSIYLPESIISIGKYAFAETQIEKFNFATTTNNIEVIEEYAFYNCKNLVSIDLAVLKNLKEIGKYAFSKISSASNSTLNVVIPYGVITIQENAFYSSDIYTVRFEENSKLEIINERVFADCQNLISVVFENGSNLYQILDESFINCVNLKIFSNADCKLETIGDKAFANCQKLELLIISEENIKEIGNGAFDDTQFIQDNDDTLVYIGTTLVKYNGIRETVIIPYDTTAIGNGAFANNNFVKSVIFEKNIEGETSVTEIQDEAFANCEQLEVIEIPNGVKTIGDKAFYNCAQLSEIEFNLGLTTIGDFAFSGCAVLSTVNLPETVSEIGNGIFVGCNELNCVEITNDNFVTVDGAVYKIDSNNGEDVAKLIIYPQKQFNGNDLVTSVVVPNDIESNEIEYSVIEIGAYAFARNSNLESIVMGNMISFIGEYAFDSIDAEVNISNTSLTEINEYVFANYLGSEIVLPQSIVGIGDYAFYNATNLSVLSLPSQIENIGKRAFSGVSADIEWNDNVTLSSLSSEVFVGYEGSTLSIPQNVNKIGSYAFNGISATINWDVNSQLEIIDEYAFAGYLGNSLVIPNTVKTIEKYAFADCVNINSIEIPSLVTTIGQYAFINVHANITFNNVVIEELSGYSFAGYKGIDFVVPESVEIISSYAFSDTSELTSINFSNNTNLVEIGEFAFYNTKIVDLEIPSSVIKIGDYAFGQNSNLDSVIFAYNENDTELIYDLGKGIFDGCYNLSQLDLPILGNANAENGYLGYLFGAGNYTENIDKIPSTLKTVVVRRGRIKSYAFYECESIENIKFDKQILNIENSALSGCVNLVSIESNYTDVLGKLFGGSKYSENAKFVPNTLKNITIISGEVLQSYAFYGCIMLETITLPQDLERIESGAFYNCIKLQGIEIGENVSYVGEQVFVRCIELASIDVAEGNVNYKSDDGILYGIKEGTVAELIAVPAIKVGKYSIGLSDENFEYEVNSIRAYAFYYSNLQEVIIPNSIELIGEYAFAYSKIISTKVTTKNVYQNSYANCVYMQKVYINDDEAVNDSNLNFLYSIAPTIFVSDNIAIDESSYVNELTNNGFALLDKKVIVEGVSYKVYTKANVYKLSVSTENENMGAVMVDNQEGSTTGQYISGTIITLTAIEKEGYTFVGWYIGNEEISTDLTYTYTTEDRNVDITAKFN